MLELIHSLHLKTHQIKTDDDSKQVYGHDLSLYCNSNPSAIVFPETEQDVVELVNWANKTQTALVPSGGRTGYSGGASALQGELVISFERMNHILGYNPYDREVTCEPGVITQELQAYARKQGLFYPVDFAATDRCHIGGNIATNAGGINVIRYGSTRDWVVGLRVVTGQGEVMSLNGGLFKNSSGYDLRHLFIGSEGTLGFITQATLHLTDPPKPSKTLCFAVNDKQAILDMLWLLRECVSITACEFFDDASMTYVCQAYDLERPFNDHTAYYVLLSYEANVNYDQVVHQRIERALNEGFIQQYHQAQDQQQAAYFWQFRIKISRSLLPYTPYKYDLAVRPSQIPQFVDEIDQLFNTKFAHLTTVWWGHVGDGNLHLNILKPDGWGHEAFIDYCHQVSKHVFGLIYQYGGTISAEHGIGLLKQPFMQYNKTSEQLSHLQTIKYQFDPQGIMNPGKLLEV